jgi:hypothetical protein
LIETLVGARALPEDMMWKVGKAVRSVADLVHVKEALILEYEPKKQKCVIGREIVRQANDVFSICLRYGVGVDYVC